MICLSCVPHKNSALEQIFCTNQTTKFNKYLQLLLKYLHLILVIISNDSMIVIFGVKLTERLEVTIKH